MAERTKTCKQCGTAFQCVISKGTTNRAYCSDFCRALARKAERQSRPKCIVDGCKNPRDYKSGLCNSCYYRGRRTGTTARKQFKYRVAHSCGYVRVMDKGHPLADVSGYVLEHRKVLYDHIGSGEHSCHWCGDRVRWESGSFKKGVSRSRLVVDHLDGDKAHNELSNLVAACNHCNANRGLFMRWVEKHRDDPVLWAMYESALSKQKAV